MTRPPPLLVATFLTVTSLALAAPPEPTTDVRLISPIEVLGLTHTGSLVFRRGPTLFRIEAGTREAVLADTAPFGPLSAIHLGLAAPGGAAVVYPVQTPSTPEEVPEGELRAGAAPPPEAPPAIAPDRPIRLIRVDGDGDQILGELQPSCPSPRTARRPAGRRTAQPPAGAPVHSISLDLQVVWTHRDVVVLGTLTCGDQHEPFVFTAPLRPPIADGAHEAVASTVDGASRGLVPMLQRSVALAAIEPSTPHRLLALAEAYAQSGDAAAAISALWRLSALGPPAKAALGQALSSSWAATLEGRAAYHALTSTSHPMPSEPADSPSGAAPPAKDSP